MLGRRKTANDAGPTTVAPEPRPGSKGRPTPKRSEAQATRRTRVTPPKDRKEAARQARERMRNEREQSRRALLTGDERNLPARDRGPVRRYVRDFVDSRRGIGEYLLPVVLVAFVLNFVPVLAVRSFSSLLMLLILLLWVADSLLLSRGLKRGVRAKFPDAEQRGLVAYALMRSTQVRRWRLPKPMVKRGQLV